MRRALSSTALATAFVLAGCGAQDEPDAVRPGDAGVVPADVSDATGPPPTTTPIPVDAYGCAGPPAVIAESMLIERRQGAPVTNCADADDPWVETTGDFVDFEIDPDATGGEVRFAARYRTSSTSNETRGETLRFERRADSDDWYLAEHVVVDLSDRRAAAERTIETYFSALEQGDYLDAAELLVNVDRPVDARADLGRLRDEGLLDIVVPLDTTAVAAALDAWCEAGAACRAPDELRLDVAADHGIRAIATYASGPADFDVLFDVTDDSVDGIPPLLQ